MGDHNEPCKPLLESHPELAKLVLDFGKKMATVDEMIEKYEENLDRIDQLQEALKSTLGQCKYWLKTYRSHTGFMNATHLMEKESLEKAIGRAEKALES